MSPFKAWRKQGPSHFSSARRAMIEQLMGQGIPSSDVLAVMGRVERERFMPRDVEHLAYADRAVPIGFEQTISQPYIVALMSDALDVKPTHRVLEIGTGSGYQTAILAELAGSVVGIERHRELSQRAAAALAAGGYRNVKLLVGDGTLGWPEEAPYDRILVAAAASVVPPALIEQLAEDGVLVIPIGNGESQELQAFRKTAGQVAAKWLSGCRFVPLVGAWHEG